MVLLAASLSSVVFSQGYFEEKFRLGSVTHFQEKLYIQTDRDSYTAGETIWFRVHRADATYHNPQLYSGLVYVDIYDYKDKLIRRMMITPSDSVFSGSYKLRKNADHGFYYMVAYTNWMQNFDSDLLFRRRIFINSPRNRQTSVTSTFHRDTRDRLRVNFDILSNMNIQWLDENYLLDVDMGGGDTTRDRHIVTRKITNDGKSDAYIQLKDSVDFLKVSFNSFGRLDDEDNFSQVIAVPYVTDKIDLQFMPEGGHLIAGIQQRVAFKALSIDGLGAEIKGTIYDSAGAMISLFSSTHLGMGDIMFTPKNGESYYAEITMEDGTQQRYDLPEVQPSGVAITCSINPKIVRILTKASPDISWSGKHFLLHCRGKLLHESPLKNGAIFDFPTKMLPNGILHCSVVDTLGVIYSQRLIFINNDDEPQLVAAELKEIYTKRNLVNFDFTLRDADGEPVGGLFTASVVDDSRAMVDTTASNLRSYMLLTSDLQGNIESPNYYFDTSESASERSRNADLLMLTQGWRRFDLTDIVLGTMREYPYSLELGQSIQGRLKYKFKDEGRSGSFVAIAPTENIVRLVSTDKDGYFEVKNIRFPNGTRFIIQGLNEKKRKQVEVQIYEETLSKILNPTIESRYLLREEEADQPDTLELKTDSDKYNKFYDKLNVGYYYDNGVLVFLMEEISVVTDKEKPEDSLDRMYKDMSDYYMTKEELLEEGFATLWDWVADLPGILVDEIEQRVTTTSRKSVKLVINEDSYSHEFLDYIDINDVVSVGLSKDVSTIMIYSGFNIDTEVGAVILIRLNDDVSLMSGKRVSSSFYAINPMGYHVADTFYVPLYDTQPLLNSTNLDSRVTIHWEPSLSVDENGKGSFEFYTADLRSDYLVRIEGVTTNGDPVSFTTRINNNW